MKTLFWLFPNNTKRGYIFSSFLSIFYGQLVCFELFYKFIRNGKSVFSVKDRTKPPKVLLDKTLGEHHFIGLKDIKLHYVSKGDPNKPLMLFLHGFPEIWYSWRYQLPEFGQNYYAVAIDMRGYGDSDKPKGYDNYSIDKLAKDVKDVVQALGKQKCILVGHDWGGMIAWMTVAQYPEIIDKFIVLNAPNIKYSANILQNSWEQFFKSWYIYFFNLPVLPEIRFKSNDFQVFDNYFNKDKQLAMTEVLEVYKYYYSKPYAITGPLNYYRALRRGTAVHFLRSAFQKRITVPTLVIWGKQDLAICETFAYHSVKSCDNYCLKMIDNCSHWTPFDRPVLVNKYIHEFLEQNH